MSLIRISNLSFTYEGSYDPVFEDVSFQIDTDWKLGFTGRNGRGKTTFLHLLKGDYEYSGNITASVDFDYFPFPVQNQDADTLEIILERMPEVEFWQLKKELGKLSMKEEALYRPFCSLSYGEQTKVLIAALFVRENQFLLIDEPTNHLDLEGRKLLGQYLNEKNGFILVSHDRAFLDSCTDHMLSINRTNIQVQRGNFSVWYENKERQDRFELEEQKKLKKEISRLKEASRQTRNWGEQVEATKIGRKSLKYEKNIGTRAYVGEKSRRMQQRRKNLERRQERAVEEKSGLLKNLETAEDLRLEPISYHKEILVSAKALRAGYRDKIICGPVSFEIRQGSRILLQGNNGCGKSSILKLILEQAGIKEDKTNQESKVKDSQLRKIDGSLEVGNGLKISYISQSTADLKGSLEEYTRKWQMEESLMKALLRKLDFSREQFDKNMEYYSEGQKKKVLIARSLCEKAHLYIWDEPLNYIDIYSRMQIEKLICTWNPTILCVEHDRAFGEAIGAETVKI